MASGSFAVTSSNKYVSAILKWSSTTNVAGNYSTVYCELRASRTNSGHTTYGTGSGTITINGTPVNFSISSSQKITQNSNTLLGSASVTVYHNDNGSKQINISAYASIPGASLTLGTTTGSATLDTIPRKSTMSVGNGTLGTAQTLTVTRQSSSFTHTITYECGTYTGTICDKSTSTSISFTPLLDFANGAPYGTSVYVSFTITTYNGNTSIGSNSYAIWCTIPDSVKPSVSLVVTDQNGYYATFGAYVQNKSKFNISVNATGAYSSSITSYSVNANGSTYNTSSVVTEVIVSSGTVTISVTVTDSRGRTASASQNVTVLPYTKPKVTNFTIKRSEANGSSNSSGNYLTVVFSSELATLNNKNGCSYALQYKKTKDGSDKYAYVNLDGYKNNLKVTNGTYTFLADTSSSYDVQLFVADSFEQISVIGVGTAVSKLFSLFNKGLGFAFGKVAELENTLEVAFDAKFYNKVYVKSPSGNFNDVGNFIDYGFITAYVPSPTTLNAQSTIPFKLGRQLGNFFTVSANGEVVVGANVKVVRITAVIGGSSSTGRVWPRLHINGSTILGGDAIAYGSFCTASFTSVCLVNEGDRIGIYVPEAFSANDGSVGCYMNIERIK